MVMDETVLLDEEAVGKILGLSVSALRVWRIKRQGPKYVRLGKQIRYRKDDLEEYIRTLPEGPISK